MPAQSSEIATPRACSVPVGAKYLGVSEQTLWRMLRDGQLERLRLRGRTLVRYSDMDALIGVPSSESARQPAGVLE
jgi:excisionase family DNA binding protein